MHQEKVGDNAKVKVCEDVTLAQVLLHLWSRPRPHPHPLLKPARPMTTQKELEGDVTRLGAQGWTLPVDQRTDATPTKRHLPARIKKSLLPSKLVCSKAQSLFGEL